MVASFFDHHLHHDASFALFTKLKKSDAAFGAHSLAEVYSSLTKMPGERVSGQDAILFLAEIQERTTIVGLTINEYIVGIERAAGMGITGGGIYDALLASCAIKVGAETIYTWNVKDFERLGRDIAARVKTPLAKHS